MKAPDNEATMHHSHFDHFRAHDGFRSSKDELRRQPLVQPIDFAKVARRNSYNPVTLARDVLISKGLHPTERPLNDHLASFKTIFASVTDKSDLSTFRWDLVDPGRDPEPNVLDSIENDPVQGATSYPGFGSSPLASSRQKEGPREFKSILSRGGGVVRGKGRTRAPRPNGSIRTQGLVSSHKHGNVRPAPHNSVSQLQSSQPAQSDMDTDVTESDDGVSGEEVGKVTSMVAASADLLQPVRDPRVSALAGREMSTPNRAPVASASSFASSGSGQKRRGRPPGSRNKKTTDAQDLALKAGASTPEIRKRGRPPGSGSKGSPSARGPGRPGRPPKERPEQIRRTMPEVGFGVNLGAPPSTNARLTSGEVPVATKRRYWKTGNLYPESSDIDAFTSFQCGWSGCQNSGLHNLETLRKHVFKIHVPKARVTESGDILCSWGACQEKKDDGERSHQSSGALEQHIEDVHLSQVVRTLGDGPASQSTGDSVAQTA